MAKKRIKKPRKKTEHVSRVPKKDAPVIFRLLKRQRWVQIGLFVFAIMLYGNTIGHQYAQDDAIVIYDNMFTTQGVQGIPGLLKYDTFYGFFKEAGKANLVSGGRYRPLTPILFALGWELFGDKPMVGHLFNVLWYALLAVLLYQVLFRLSAHSKQINPYVFACLGALFFIAHPVHTEVVANIKGRDEIISLFGALLALYCVFRARTGSKYLWGALAGVAFFAALMAKENAITFLLVVPICLMWFKRTTIRQAALSSIPLIIAAAAFMLIRTSVLDWNFGSTSMELMNNPFIKVENGQYMAFAPTEKGATILFTLGKYVQLLLFPHPLTHDYYPRHIGVMSFSSIWVWLSMITYLALVATAVFAWKRHRWITFGIVYYLITLSIVSNIVFPIGTNMSERFLFMPSVGFAVILAYSIARFLWTKKRFKIGVAVTLLFLLLYSAKTIDRNRVWNDDFTLFTTDVHTSSSSAKLLNAAGGALSNEAIKAGNEGEKESMLRQALIYLQRAIDIHPRYKNAHLIAGNCHHFLGEYERAIPFYERALQLDPGFKEAADNLGINFREAGRYYGQEVGDLAKATQYFERAYQLRPNEYETVRLLGISHGRSGRHAEAVRYFREAVAMRPDIAQAHVNLGNALAYIGEEEKAQASFERAKAIDPNALNQN